MPGPPPVWGARTSLGVPGPVRGARASYVMLCYVVLEPGTQLVVPPGGHKGARTNQHQPGCARAIGVPGQIWCAKVTLGCQGYYRRAKTSLKSKRQFGVPESIWNASASLEYQGKSEVWRPIWDVNASLGCPRLFELPGPIWDAMANVKWVLHQICYQVTCATRCAVHCCCKATGVH